jgi:5-methylcytosine-specific restriction endonuclease McrA
VKRTTPLRADPEKVREFMRRNRRPLNRGTQKRRATIPPDTRRRVYARSRRRCIACGKPGRLTIHHVLAVERWPALELVEANMVGVHWPCHAAHEAASRRIRWGELPECAVTLAHATSGAAVLELERRYPR